MRLGGLQKVTLVDVPGKVAATVFTQGCNLRCPYCHNPELVLASQFGPGIEEAEVLDFLEARRGKLEAVCVTGGEPTLHGSLPRFLRQLKGMGYFVKLDSNGSRPDTLGRLFDEGLVDYLAMDIKGPRGRYAEIAGQPCLRIDQIERSVQLIMDHAPDYEFRTTVSRPLLSPADFQEVASWLAGARRFYLQNFRASKQLDSQAVFEPFSAEELSEARILLATAIAEVGIR